MDYKDDKDKLDLYLPKDRDNFPVIMLIHPGALMLGEKEWFDPAARFFAQNGFGSVAINYRLSPCITPNQYCTPESAPFPEGTELAHPAHIEDTAQAFAWIYENIQSYGGNPEEIFVVGHSAGAYLAALLATDGKYLANHGLSLENIRGVAPISGFFYVDREGVAPDRPKSVWGTDEQVWVEASPAQYVGAEAPPTLILYASGDDAWRKEQTEEYVAALRDVGHTSVAVKEVANRDHLSIFTSLGRPADETTRVLLNFVASNLQGQ